MANQGGNSQPNFDRLYSILVTSGLQESNPALYQVIEALIRAIQKFQNLTNGSITAVTTIASSIQGSDFITWSDESITLPNSRNLRAGQGISLHKTPDNIIRVDSTLFLGGGDGGGGGGEEGAPGPPGVRGPAGVAGAVGAQGNSGPPGLDGTQGETIEPMMIPGVRGLTGSAGATGATGAQGPVGFPLIYDGVDGEPSYFPGPQGIQGIQGPAGGGGGGSATIVEVDLGSTLAWEGRFTISDTTIATTSKVSVWQASGPYTGKGTLADEAIMDYVHCIAEPLTGSATVYWRSVEGFAYKPNVRSRGLKAFPLSEPTGDTTAANNSWGLGFKASPIGKVKGNFKFGYSVFT